MSEKEAELTRLEEVLARKEKKYYRQVELTRKALNEVVGIQKKINELSVRLHEEGA